MELVISSPLIDVHLIVILCWYRAVGGFGSIVLDATEKKESFLGSVCSNGVVGKLGQEKPQWEGMVLH